MTYTRFSFSRGLFLLTVMLAFSCKTQRLFEAPESSHSKGDVKELMLQVPHMIRPDDKISLSVWDHEELSIGSIFGDYNSNEVYGKWVMVDTTGRVPLPKLGRVKIAGLSIQQATDTIAKLYSKVVVDPVVILKVHNRSVTVLGEVKQPGSYNLEKEFNSLPEVLGRASGVDYYADSRIIQVLRAEGEKRIEYSVDLTQLSSIDQQMIWLRSGDIVYVPPAGKKAFQRESPSVLVPLAAILSSLAVLITLVNN